MDRHNAAPGLHSGRYASSMLMNVLQTRVSVAATGPRSERRDDGRFRQWPSSSSLATSSCPSVLTSCGLMRRPSMRTSCVWRCMALGLMAEYDLWLNGGLSFAYLRDQVRELVPSSLPQAGLSRHCESAGPRARRCITQVSQEYPRSGYARSCGQIEGRIPRSPAGAAAGRAAL